MNNQDEPIIQIIVDEIADNQDRNSNKHVKKKLKGVKKSLTVVQTNGQKQAFDGKQQFGDKQICRICNRITTLNGMIMCNRCHFRYHKSCVNHEQIMEGSKWQCERCKKKIEQLKLKAENPRKKVKRVSHSDALVSQQLDAEELKQKMNDFLTLYPTYKNQGQIQLPIIDEYLIAYADLFKGESQKKPQIKDDQDIPPQYFEQVLQIWDAYNNYDKIISDLLYIEDEEEKCQSNTVGTFIHFRDNHQPYSQKTRKQIYEMIKTNPDELILFFVYFYTKQLIEDVDMEQMSKQQYNPFWNIMGFLWYNNRNQYYELLKESASQNIVFYLQKQDLLNSIQEPSSTSKEEKSISILTTLINGLLDLKKTQQLVTFRIENLISNNKIKQQLANQVKELRTLQLEFKEKLNGWYKECENLKAQKQQNQLSKAELIKQGKELEYISKQLQLNKKEEEDVAKKLFQIQERYTQLEEELHLVQVPSLLLNPSMFLGQDLKNSLYYFFLHEKDKVFVQWKNSWIEDQMKWGYTLFIQTSYYCLDDVFQLIKTLNVQGVKESQLKANIEEILKQKLLSSQPDNISVGIHKVNREGDSTEKEDYVQGLLPIKRKFQEISILSLSNLFSEIENNLSTFLNEKNCRWCSASIRNNFKKSYDNQNSKSLQKAIEFFLENTQIQEKIELRKEGEIIDNNQPYIDLDEDSLQYIPRKRKVIEDETSDNENFRHLEQMDNNKLKVRRVPMRLFGAYFENLRQNILDLVKEETCDLLQIKTCLVVLKYVIRDYIRRKKQEQQKLITKEKKALFIEPEAVIIELQKKTKKQEEVIEADNDWEETCKICGLGGKVLLCDSCPRVFHPRCLKLKEIPKGKWNCMICQSYFSRQVKTRQTLKKLQTQ